MASVPTPEIKIAGSASDVEVSIVGPCILSARPTDVEAKYRLTKDDDDAMSPLDPDVWTRIGRFPPGTRNIFLRVEPGTVCYLIRTPTS